MRVTLEQLTPLGQDAQRVHFIDTAFLVTHTPDRVGVAVSGGGDSMALLHAAHVWSGLSGVEIEAVTVNHGLRAEAAQEAELVARACSKWDVAHAVLQWDGGAATGNIAAAGRDARYELIAEWAKSRDISGVLLGHTEDDVAETFLMRLARKSGVDGLAMMASQFDRSGVRWSRPFWQQTRAELRDYLIRHDIPWVDDPTNEDETHERPKARKALAALAPLGITSEVLKSVALNMSGAQSALEHYACEEARRLVAFEGGDVVLPRRIRPPVPPEIERRLMVAALRYVGGANHPPRRYAMADLDAGLSVSGKHTLSGCIVTQDKTSTRIAREFDVCKDNVCSLDDLWDGRWKVVGPHAPNLEVRALGELIKDVPDWRETGLPRASLMATPAVFDGDTLIAAPVAGLQNGFEARIVSDFQQFLLSR